MVEGVAVGVGQDEPPLVPRLGPVERQGDLVGGLLLGVEGGCNGGCWLAGGCGCGCTGGGAVGTMRSEPPTAVTLQPRAWRAPPSDAGVPR